MDPKLSILHVIYLVLFNLKSVAYACEFEFVNEFQCVHDCVEANLSKTTCIPSCDSTQDAICICNDNTFNILAAQCVYTECGPDILKESEIIYAGFCEGYGVTLDPAQLISAGEQGQQNTISAPSAATSIANSQPQTAVTVFQSSSPTTPSPSTEATSSGEPVTTPAQPTATTPSPTPMTTPTPTMNLGGQVPLSSITNAAPGRWGVLGRAGALGVLGAALNGAAVIL